MRLPKQSDPDHALVIEHRRKRLRLISRAAEWIALAAIALVIASCVYLWFDRDALIAFLRKDVPGSSSTPSDAMVAAAYWICLVPAAVFIAGMWQARALFRLFGGSRIIAPEIPGRLVRLGALAVAAAILGIVVRTLVVLIMTIDNPPGQRQLVIGISSNELSFLVVGLLFLAFALVMQEAQRIEDEIRSFV